MCRPALLLSVSKTLKGVQPNGSLTASQLNPGPLHRVIRFRSHVLALALSLPAAGTSSHAQEFTTQTLLVAPFESANPRLSRAVERRARSRLARSVNRREVRVVGSDTIENSLRRAGYGDDVKVGVGETRVLSRMLRADEVVVGQVVGKGNLVEVNAQIMLPRDWRMRQPLPLIRAATPAAAADTLSQYVMRARAQMLGLRRCENAMRVDDHARAIRGAEEGVLTYSASTLARTCLAVALRLNGMAADSVIRVAEAVLARDSLSIVAAVVRARSLSESGDAVGAWDYVLQLRPDSLDLALSAVEEMLRLQAAERALRGALHLAAIHKEEMRVRRLAFRAYVALSRWKDAAVLGDSLDYQDVAFRSDSSYAIRHIEALRLSGDTLSAISKSARSVKEFPGDKSLYLQYAQLVKVEDGAVFPRGLALFPNASELHILSARNAVAAGKRRDALASLGAAVQADTSLTQGFLQIADLWFNENEPDSAVAAVARAPRGGARSELVRTYAIARGRQMISGVEDTAFTVWRRAIALFFVADSVDSREDTRSLLTASHLQVARGALVLGSKTRDCPNATRATDALATASLLLERGVGDGASADQLKEAYAQMRPIAEQATQSYCSGAARP